MEFKLTVYAEDIKKEQEWARLLEWITQRISKKVNIELSHDKLDPGQMLFVDNEHPGLIKLLSELERKNRAIYLIIEDGKPVPDVYTNDMVDGVLVYPFRPVEVIDKFKAYERILMWDEVKHLNNSFSESINLIKEDLKIAEKLQRKKFPTRFPKFKDILFTGRYLAGLRTGGDYLEVFESKADRKVSLFLSDSSSYGLSSSVLMVLMSMALKLSSVKDITPIDTVKSIYDELLLTLGDKDYLSLFFGVISRKDYNFRYLNLGSTKVFHAKKDKDFLELPSQGKTLSKDKVEWDKLKTDAELKLSSDDRIILVSDGTLESIGGYEALLSILNEFRQKDGKVLLSELLFQIKRKLPDDPKKALPPQDCTLFCADIGSNILRLA